GGGVPDGPAPLASGLGAGHQDLPLPWRIHNVEAMQASSMASTGCFWARPQHHSTGGKGRVTTPMAFCMAIRGRRGDRSRTANLVWQSTASSGHQMYESGA